jgi:hypothetical protein
MIALHGTAFKKYSAIQKSKHLSFDAPARRGGCFLVGMADS